MSSTKYQFHHVLADTAVNQNACHKRYHPSGSTIGDSMASVSLKEMNRDTASMLILYVLGKMNDGTLDEVQFQKAMFRALLILGIDPAAVGYRPHFYGPYSDLMEEKKKGLEDIGYLDSTGKGVRVSPDESDIVSRISLRKDADDFVRHMVNSLSGFKNDELLLMTYCDDERKTGGRYIQNSYVRDDIFRNRVPIAARMYHDGKISLDRGAELAGMSVKEFQDELIDRFGCAYVD